MKRAAGMRLCATGSRRRHGTLTVGESAWIAMSGRWRTALARSTACRTCRCWRRRRSAISALSQKKRTPAAGPGAVQRTAQRLASAQERATTRVESARRESADGCHREAECEGHDGQREGHVGRARPERAAEGATGAGDPGDGLGRSEAGSGLQGGRSDGGRSGVDVRTCSGCGAVDETARRSQTEFVCVAYGPARNADAARNIPASRTGASARRDALARATSTTREMVAGRASGSPCIWFPQRYIMSGMTLGTVKE